MKNSNVYFLLFFGLCLAFLWDCEKKEINTTADNNTKQVKIDNVVTVNFPNGSIATANPTVDKITDTNIQSIFDETADLFDIGNSINYQVKISIGNLPPNNNDIEVVLNLPNDFLSQIPESNDIDLFALTYQDGGEEILDNFEIIPSTYVSTSKTLLAKLPIWVFSNARNLNYETVLTIASTPGVIQKSTKSDVLTDDICLGSQITCPTNNCTNISSGYNMERFHSVLKVIRPHWGTDFRVNPGSPLYAAADGRVIRIKTQVDKSGSVTGYGLYIIIRHFNRMGTTLYAHLSKSLVSLNQTVKKGQQIAESGNSGTSTGPHLHFEYVPSGEIIHSEFRINPFPCITPATLATITTIQASNITTTSATSGGNIGTDDGFAILASGVCWSTSSNPTIGNNKTTDGKVIGLFSSSITGLSPNTKYFVRAYATNSAGTAYGNEVSFQTIESTLAVTTTEVTGITSTSAASGGIILYDGGSNVTARGVCWNTSGNPTIANSKTSNGTGVGSFASSITSLTAGTIYYVRAYATNSSGTVYGNEISFTSRVNSPTITTAEASSVTTTSATCGGNVTNDGGTSVTSRGVCWSTASNPTTSNNKTSNGTGIGNFTSSLTSLVANTTYYVRAYAINSAGTSYGNEISFITSTNLPTITTKTATSITNTTASSGGNVTSDGGNNVTARGVCWSTVSNPTITNTKTTDGAGTGSFTSSITGLTPNTTYYVRAYATNSIGTAYGSNLSFTTTSGSGNTISDVDGNIYSIVTIGSQVWIASNLKTTRYNDGTTIPLVSDNTAWSNLSSPGYCWYNNDAASNKSIYGALYNWYTVNSNKLCPTGWHVPSDAEWTVLTTYLGGEDVAGGKLKETGTIHWTTPNTGATNSSGFTALPGGCRYVYGTFFYIGNNGYWWSSTESSTLAWFRYLTYGSSLADYYDAGKRTGFSVRCVKN